MFKAWSQNLGHEHLLTTFTSYGNVAQLAVHVGFAFHVEVVIGARKIEFTQLPRAPSGRWAMVVSQSRSTKRRPRAISADQ
jgi:hypothetical protein